MTAPRAERLRVVLALCDGLPYIDPGEAAEQGLPPFSPAERALLKAAEDEDLALVNACLEIEEELRRRAYDALERLLAAVAGRAGDLPSRIASLPEREMVRAIADLYETRWVYR